MTEYGALTLGMAVDRLAATVAARRNSTPDTSYTAKLLANGPAFCAKKLGEEAIEAALAGAVCDAHALTAEAADVVYHLLVLMAAAGVEPADLAREIMRREGVSGIDEKSSRHA